jgi:hypothetical protein
MQKYLMLFFGAVAIYGIYHFWPTSQSTTRPPTPKIAGLDDLLDCEPFYFFSGDRSLEFSESTKVVTLVENAKEGSKTPERRALGEWSLDSENQKRYWVSIDGSAARYWLVKPQTSDICILARGESLNEIDLQQSWFGRNALEADYPDDRERDSP